jgi:Tol biopolymer transport system component
MVSPDGRHIIFQVQRNGVWLLELPSGAMRRVLEDPTASEYTWAPDSRRVAYYSGRSGTWGVWVMAPR